MIASVGQILGLEDILCGRKYTSNVKCITKFGTVLRIKLDDFFKIVNKDDRSTNFLDFVRNERDNVTIGKLRHSQRMFK